jgi:EpsI family protein
LTNQGVAVAVADPIQSSKRVPMTVVLAAALMLGALGISQALKPTRLVADELPPLVLEEVVPKKFGDWRLDESAPPVIADPSVKEAVDKLYSGMLNRTYVNSKGEKLLMLLAYGRNQNSWSTAAHRPEFCYFAQGYVVEGMGAEPMALSDHTIQTVHLVATRGHQMEPISYWVTLADTATIPGINRKFQQIRYGLQGLIVDGMLVRLSTLSQDPAQAFKLHTQFVQDWERATPPAFRPRLFGH